MRNNYDAVATWYDRLSRLVFGRVQVVAQTVLLPYVTAGSRILIVGGGSGWILEELAKIHPSGLSIIYVEISANMLALSRQRNAGENEVQFVQQAIEDYQPAGTFDVVFTAFLFDNFTEEKVQTVFSLLHDCLTPGGKWLYADFQYTTAKGTWWQRWLLNMMLVVCKILCQVEATTLVNLAPFFTGKQYTTVFNKSSYRSFIHSVVYQKPL